MIYAAITPKSKEPMESRSYMVCVFGMLLSHSGSSQLAAARRYSSLGEGNQAMYPLQGKYFCCFSEKYVTFLWNNNSIST